MKFSSREVHDLLISWIVLSVAFTLLRQGGIFGIFSRRSVLFQDVFLFPKMFVIVGTAFVLHELSHKYVAQTYNLMAEYRKWTQGLIFAFILSLTGFFLFAAPGAVMIMGAPWVTPEIEAKISLAGPIANITVGITALLVKYSFNLPFLTELAAINFFLAVFNLLPIYPMDGSKVLRYNMVTWIVAFGSAVVLLLWAL